MGDLGQGKGATGNVAQQGDLRAWAELGFQPKRSHACYAWGRRLLPSSPSQVHHPNRLGLMLSVLPSLDEREPIGVFPTVVASLYRWSFGDGEMFQRVRLTRVEISAPYAWIRCLNLRFNE